MAEYVGVVGSRDYEPLSEVAAFIASLPPDTIVVSGGARGVDEAAEQAALARHLAVEVYRLDYQHFGRRAPLVRNGILAAQCDRLVAFMVPSGSAGTRHVVAQARRMGRPVTVYGPGEYRPANMKGA